MRFFFGRRTGAVLRPCVPTAGPPSLPDALRPLQGGRCPLGFGARRPGFGVQSLSSTASLSRGHRGVLGSLTPHEAGLLLVSYRAQAKARLGGGELSLIPCTGGEGGAHFGGCLPLSLGVWGVAHSRYGKASTHSLEKPPGRDSQYPLHREGEPSLPWCGGRGLSGAALRGRPLGLSFSCAVAHTEALGD